MNIRRATVADAVLIRDLAEVIWPPTFKEILSQNQLRYMLDWMYAPETLKLQIAGGHEFYIIEDPKPVGFICIELNHPDQGVLKIHKLYVLPQSQGKGYGKKLVEKAIFRYNEENLHTLTLNVNRFNPAVAFYKRLGFTIERTEDIDIGNGYLMEDFVMNYTD
jgi:ribosomal protein S18 acetylase RimI-like enzyme